MMDYVYDGTCVRVIDGDTVVLRLAKTFALDIDFGFHVKDTVSLAKSAEITFRLNGLNTPEIVGPSKATGLAAKTALEGMLVGKSLRVVSHKPDKYGRWLADVFVQGETVSVNQRLIEGGFAVPWSGTGPKPVV